MWIAGSAVGFGDGFLGDAEGGEALADLIAVAEGDGAQVDGHAVGGDDEVLDALEVKGNVPGQCELVFAGDFGEHFGLR